MSADGDKARTAVYAGSFDPPTNGHIGLLERGARIFGQIVVAVGDNPRKRYMFTVEERLAMIRKALAHVPNVEVQAFDGLLVDFCKEVNSRVILRGLRAVGDFEFEYQLGLANMDLEPDIETVFLLAGPETLFVSSSIVKEIADGGRSVADYVPAHVEKALLKRLAEGDKDR